MLFLSNNNNNKHHYQKTLKHCHLSACIEKLNTQTPRHYTLFCHSAKQQKHRAIHFIQSIGWETHLFVSFIHSVL